MKHAKDTLRLDDGMKINNASPLGCAAYFSTPEIVEALLDAGADVLHVNDVRRRSALPYSRAPASPQHASLERTCARRRSTEARSSWTP